MIRKLMLKNWKSHKESSFDFSEGTNVLIGIMGSGKSSIMQAITFALFGTFPELSQKKIKIEDVVSRGETDAFVEISFELDRKIYTVRRTIENGRTTTSEFLENGILLESPQSSKVTDAIQSIIKMDYDLFVRAIYAEQNAIDYFLTIPRGQRMKKIDTLLKLDKFETARANVNTLLNKLKDEKKTKMVLLERLEMDESIKSYDRIKQEMRNLKERITDYEDQSIAVSKELESIKREIISLEDQEKKRLEVDRKSIAIKTSIEELERRSKDLSTTMQGKLLLEDPEKMESDYKKLLESHTKIESELKKNESELSTLKARLDVQRQMEKDISSRIDENRGIRIELESLGSLDNIKNAIIEKSKEMDNEKRILFSSRSEIEHQKEHIFKLSKDGCPVCERELDESLYEKIKLNKENKITDLENLVKLSSEKIDLYNSEIKDWEVKRSRLEILLQRILLLDQDEKKYSEIMKALDEMTSKVPSIEANVAHLRLQVDRTQTEMDILESQMDELKSMEEKKKELSEIQERLESLYVEKRKTETLLSEMSGDPELLRNLRLRSEKTSSQKAMLDSQTVAEKRILIERQDRLETIESQKKMLDLLRDEINRIENISRQLKLFSETLEVTQSRLRQEFVKTVNMVMSEVWKEFYPYQDYTDIRLSIEDGDYVLELLSKTWLSVEGVASGGERSSAALILRIALALVLAPNLRWLILDEPTHNLDANAIEQLSSILRHKIGEFVDQVFLITHEPRLEDAVSGYLYRLDRPESKRTPTQVQRIDVLKD